MLECLGVANVISRSLLGSGSTWSQLKENKKVEILMMKKAIHVPENNDVIFPQDSTQPRVPGALTHLCVKIFLSSYISLLGTSLAILL